MSGVGIESHFAIESGQQGMCERQGIARRFSAHGLRKFDDRGISLREWRITKIKLRREPLDCTADEAIGVLRVDFAFHGDSQIIKRAICRERVKDVAERVFVLTQQAILR